MYAYWTEPIRYLELNVIISYEWSLFHHNAVLGNTNSVVVI